MSWSGDEGSFITEMVREKPLLNVCAGNAMFGDLRVDAFHPWPDVKADAIKLPFKDDSFAATFMDPPWGLEAMKALSEGFKEGLRVAPILYIYSPVVWGSSRGAMTDAWLRCLPGLNHPVILQRYERAANSSPKGRKRPATAF